MEPWLRLELDDVLGALAYARRSGDLGRLAVLADGDVRRWARQARRDALAAVASDFATKLPFASREDFLATIDVLIAELESIRSGPCLQPGEAAARR